ncbi:MAG: hypothetical protein HZC15_06425 [Candidatus Omnitrophica bacterium]|nr:hypothetical protein [Candidatus Omnitrophota bacterium]
MNKAELINEIERFIALERKAENDFLPFHLRLLNDSSISQDKKTRCKHIIDKLTQDSITHAKILEELRDLLIRSEEDGF